MSPSKMIFPALTVMGRSSTAAKYLDVSIWLCRGLRTSRSHPSSSVKSLRLYSQRAQQKESRALSETKTGGSSEVTAFEAVKETTKAAANLGVVLIGLGIAGSILWAVCRELFSGNSPNNIYSKAVDRCISDQRIQDHLGEPIKAFGEENRRGRRRHVSHAVYEVDGRKHMMLKFYIQGSRKRGTVYVEMREDDRGNYQRDLLAVELDDLLRTQIILEDNRGNSANQNASLPTLN